ncbi:hypothetical protein VAPA_1c32750 [Variovorax paradoxus B4]|uniref:Mor transcription activator domain-containing protein n=1 Tax=Variovorax paradoxus B4 TaxID=1246301 RepID=T1XCZ5_VARPD|nr:hypothetical protein [Variovorax paradoxus]AGU50361.1 hypothetical protein VAPA_1c32750 [Variovorax paradoxus B4]
MALLPGVAQEIADVIGRERTLFLIGQLPRHFGGAPGRKSWRVTLYAPRVERLCDDHRLVIILGRADAEKICQHFGGETLQVANCSSVAAAFRNRELLKFAAAGVHRSELAVIFDLTERRVAQLVASATPKPASNLNYCVWQGGEQVRHPLT